ncbi:MAG: CHAT domain-containing protein, partial [Caldilinea sp.]
ASVGAQLLQTGMPAVIAMQFDIEEGVAGNFAQYFYQELFGGQCPGVVHRAVSFARSNLYALNPDSIGYTTPILWLNAPDGAIFDGAHLPSISSSRRTEHSFTAQDFAPLQQQMVQIEQWCAGIIPLGAAELPVTLRPVQRLLQDALRDIGDLLVQLHHLDSEPPSERILKQYKEKLERIEANRGATDRLAAIIRTQQEQRGEA